ncbi:MAG: universal stress protein [Acaryochloris sp. RU_4_1]|nr:universal stress protein [Acaryochloris sp. RU_4_1]NJN38249.1 universal stress protein [Acaryochloridaceae cyanobacterium CSU_3_4]NJR56087.1 universal stress protein [Acaryochloris sp. CRU_2_0]
MFHRLLITTDFTDGLHRLVNFIPALAQMGLEQVVFLHCVPLQADRNIPQVDVQRQAAAKAKLERALENCPSNLSVHIELPTGLSSVGARANAILAAVKKYQSELIVVGTSIHSLLNEKLFGSTTRELAQKTSVPLLILRPQLVSAYTDEELSLRCQHLLRYLLIPYDGSPSGQSVVNYIEAQAKNRPPQSLEACMLCWVLEKAGRKEVSLLPTAEDCTQLLQAQQQRLEALDLQVNIDVRQGNAIAEIQQVALDFDISAIVVSSKHFGRLWELSIPSFAGEMVRRSWHPILFIPPIN